MDERVRTLVSIVKCSALDYAGYRDPKIPSVQAQLNAAIAQLEIKGATIVDVSSLVADYDGGSFMIRYTMPESLFNTDIIAKE